MYKILFLCHGNICRSPMAEYIMKDKVRKLKIENKYYIVSKALSHEEIGNDIYPSAKRCLERHGIAFDRHYASYVLLSDYDDYDEIYVMDRSNMYLVKRLFEDKENKISYLNNEIEDPWYTDNFEKVYTQIEEGINGILKRHEEIF